MMKNFYRLIRMFWIPAFLSMMTAGTVFADNIKVGVLLPLTGKLAGAGRIERNSFGMAVNEINAAGGVAGRKIDLIVENSATSPDVGVAAVEKLISQERVIVLGGGCSSPVTLKAVAKAQERQVPFLVNTASADELTEMKKKYVFSSTRRQANIRLHLFLSLRKGSVSRPRLYCMKTLRSAASG